MNNFNRFTLVILYLFFFSFAFSQEFSLPKLNYGYNDLEPYIDGKTMEIHYSKHHKTYVDNLNKAVSDNNLKGISLEELMFNVSNYGTAIRNNGGGHYNHTLFWSILTPGSTGKPDGKLAEMINSEFGSFENFKKTMNEAATSRFGSGWAWLILTKNNKLVITSTPNQDNPLMDISEVRGIPLLGIDVWEHAYYLKYQNKRADYLEAVWNVINWKEVEKNLNNAINSNILKKL
ncbi:MAG: superoxide dismutase [Bacteroidales bacterium]|jgi:Fe-Mn family superoxide dismutase|nr:superoxide dismutase [Bacteroidales bacterium]